MIDVTSYYDVILDWILLLVLQVSLCDVVLSGVVPVLIALLCDFILDRAA